MSDNKEIKKHAGYAKTEIELASKHLKEGVSCDIDYVLTMLDEAIKQLDIITDYYCE